MKMYDPAQQVFGQRDENGNLVNEGEIQVYDPKTKGVTDAAMINSISIMSLPFDAASLIQAPKSLIRPSMSILDNSSSIEGVKNIKNRIWLRGSKEIEGWEGLRPAYNEDGYPLVQDVFIENHNKYMDSPLFEQKMKEFYPDINIEEYKNAINHNLKREYLTYKSPTEYTLRKSTILCVFRPYIIYTTKLSIKNI